MNNFLGKTSWFLLVVLTTSLFLTAQEVKVVEKPVVSVVFSNSQDPYVFDPQADILKENRIFNKSGSQCVWCSLETAARHEGITELYDLTSKYTFATGDQFVNTVLTQRNINFKMQWEGTGKNTNIIETYLVKKCYPVAFGVPGHMLVLCHYDKEKQFVRVIDNVDRELRVQKWTMEQFMNRWTGWAVVVLPKQ